MGREVGVVSRVLFRDQENQVMKEEKEWGVGLGMEGPECLGIRVSCVVNEDEEHSPEGVYRPVF